jgi:hypothetical protein
MIGLLLGENKRWASLKPGGPRGTGRRGLGATSVRWGRGGGVTNKNRRCIDEFSYFKFLPGGEGRIS